jgi:WD40 repeat protein
MVKYEAFISYKHNEVSRRQAESLEKALKSYAKPLLKPPIKIFRDEKELSPGDDLNASIKIALENSKYLIYLASKEAAESVWVQNELRYWCENLGRVDNLIICLIDDDIDVDANKGEINWSATNALPSFLNQFIISLPLFINLSWATNPKELNLDNIRFRELINSVKAKFQKKSPAEMNDEHVLNHRKNLRLKLATQLLVVTLTVVSLFFAFYSLKKRNEEYRQKKIAIIEKNRAVINSLISEARRMLSIDNTKALRIAEMAYDFSKKNSPEKIPLVLRTLNEIIKSSRQYPFYSQNFLHSKTSNLAVNSVTYSPDGKYLLTASSDKTAKIWNNFGELIKEFKHEDRVDNATFSPDCKKILTTCSMKNYSTIWDVDSTSRFILRHNNWVLSAVFSPDGKRVLTASRDSTAILWSIEGKRLLVFNYPKNFSGAYNLNFVNSACFSPDGRKIITAANYDSVILWNYKGEKLASFLKTNLFDKSASFSPNGQYILTHSRFTPPKLWNLQRKHIATFDHKNLGGIYFTAFHPKENKIITVCDDKKAKIWDYTGKELMSMQHNENVRFALFSPSGKKIITLTEGLEALLWKDDGTLLARFKLRSKIGAVAFSPNEDEIITAAYDGTIRKFRLDIETFHEERHTPDTFQKCWVHFSRNGDKIITKDGSNSVRILNNKWKEIAVLIDKSKVRFAILSPNGDKVFTINNEKVGRLWTIKGKEINSYHFQKDIIYAEYSPCGRWFLTVSEEYITRILDLTWKIKLEIPETSVQPPPIFSLDGNKILYVSTNLVKSLNYRVANLRSIIAKEDDVKYMHRDDINAISFSPDNTKVLTACDDKYARLFDDKGNILYFFKHDGEVSNAIFSQQSDRILTSSYDKTAKVWSSDGKLIKTLNHDIWVSGCAFSPNGEYIATFSTNNVVRLWGDKYNRVGEFRWQHLIGHVDFSARGEQILIFSHRLAPKDQKIARVWYTPKKIVEWLKTANIANLSIDEKNSLFNGDL